MKWVKVSEWICEAQGVKGGMECSGGLGAGGVGINGDYNVKV